MEWQPLLRTAGTLVPAVSSTCRRSSKIKFHSRSALKRRPVASSVVTRMITVAVVPVSLFAMTAAIGPLGSRILRSLPGPERNGTKTVVTWSCATADARIKLTRLCPPHQP